VRGYIDSTAGEIVAGDTLLDPMTGVLCRVTSVEAPQGGTIAIHMIGSVSLSYMGLCVKPDRPLRRGPRAGEMPASGGEGSGSPPRFKDMNTADVSGQYVTNPHVKCACGFKTRTACAELCLKG
jgi:hypothetical protein